MATTTYSDISSCVPSIVAAAIPAFQNAGPCLNLVKKYYITNNTASVPVWSAVSVAAMSEGVPLATTQTVAPSAVTITCAKYGAKAILTDEAVTAGLGGNIDLITEAGSAIGRGLGVTVDQAIIALFDGFTTGALGSGSGSTMSMTLLGTGIGQLTDNAAPGPYNLVLSGMAMNYLMTDLKYTAPAGGITAAEQASPWFQGVVGGVRCFTSPNFTVASSAVKGALFSPDAIGCAIAKDVQIEVERISGVGWEVTGWMRFGVSELKEAGGVEYHVKSA